MILLVSAGPVHQNADTRGHHRLSGQQEGQARGEAQAVRCKKPSRRSLFGRRVGIPPGHSRCTLHRTSRLSLICGIADPTTAATGSVRDSSSTILRSGPSERRRTAEQPLQACPGHPVISSLHTLRLLHQHPPAESSISCDGGNTTPQNNFIQIRFQANADLT